MHTANICNTSLKTVSFTGISTPAQDMDGVQRAIQSKFKHCYCVEKVIQKLCMAHSILTLPHPEGRHEVFGQLSTGAGARR